MSPEFINNIATFAGVIVAALGAFVFAFWVAMGIWTFNDMRQRSTDWLAIVLAVLLVMVFPLVGLILYTLIRPRSTLAEVYDRALEEEALLRELEESVACPNCGTPVKDAWVFCPTCHSQLQHACPTCSTMVRNEWAICVSCGTPQRGATTRLIPEPALAQPVLSHTPVAPSSLGQPQLGPSQLGQPQASLPYGAELEPPPLRRPQRNPFARETGAPPEDLDDLYRSARAGEG